MRWWWWKGRAGASHYCRVRLCRSLGNPSQSTHIQLLPLNQFEAAATSHLSQQPAGGTRLPWATAPPTGGLRREVGVLCASLIGCNYYSI